MSVATGYGKEPEPSTSSLQCSQQCRHFEYSEILLATDNFDESLVIGEGGFGKVYTGTIFNGSTTDIAAIKRLDPNSSQGAPEFWSEVEMLSKFRHCNLVSLFGYCNHQKEMILVYEYMPNGTLEDHLHKFGTPLSWIQRLKICIGAAQGLHYLHTGTGIEVGVIHRDVKTSNILLHESWAAKISDFGLSKIGRTNRPTTGVNTVVKGTFGYLDPDYYATGKLTRKSDVYAFGVVLLEVLCRKRAVFDIDEQAFNLAIWAQESIKEGNLKKIIDPDLRGQISSKCLKEFVRIVERCLHMYPKKRTTMAEIAVSLESVTILQEKFNNSMQTSGTTIFGRMVDMFGFSSKGENSGVPSSSSLPDANELETCIAQSQAPTNRLHISGYENENNNDIEKPLPTIEGSQILGDAFPGHNIQASGYDANELESCIAQSQAPTNSLHISGYENENHDDIEKPLPMIEGSQIPGDAFPGHHEIQASGCDANELETCIAQSQAPTNRLNISGYENENHDDIEQLLPMIEDLQIPGDAFPGHVIEASGYSRNKTTSCNYVWVRRLQDGSHNKIEGATKPYYMVSADDIDTYLVLEVTPLGDNQRKGKLVQCVANDDTYLSVEVQPFGDNQRKGERVLCFANDGKKITCHPNMIRQIENKLQVGHSVFQVLVRILSSETWEPAKLEIKKNSYKIKLDRPKNGVVVDNKYTQSTLISLPVEIPNQFSILSQGSVKHDLEVSSTDISCSRDTIVLTMRLFVKGAVDRKLGKKRVLFF